MGAPTTSEVVKPALPVSKDVPTATLTAKLEKR
jgi:hypothetical protein